MKSNNIKRCFAIKKNNKRCKKSGIYKINCQNNKIYCKIHNDILKKNEISKNLKSSIDIWLELKQLIKDYNKNYNINYNKPATEIQLKAFEKKNNCIIPEDLRCLLLIHNGIDDKNNGILDQALWPSLKDLEDIINKKDNKNWYGESEQNCIKLYDVFSGTIMECSYEPDMDFPWEIQFDSIKHWLQCILQCCKDTCFDWTEDEKNNCNRRNKLLDIGFYDHHINRVYGVKLHQKSIYYKGRLKINRNVSDKKRISGKLTIYDRKKIEKKLLPLYFKISGFNNYNYYGDVSY